LRACIFAALREAKALGQFNAQNAGRASECLKRVSESKGCRKYLISTKRGEKDQFMRVARISTSGVSATLTLGI
jgi:hypothetical protein